MTGIAVVVFDLDDTLYLERDFVRSGYAAVAARLNPRLGSTDFAERAAAAFDSGQRSRIFDTVLAELGHGDDQPLIDEAVARYRDHVPAIRLAADARRYLARCHYQLALLSDGYLQTQAHKVAALGLDAFGFRPVVLTGLWGRDYWKPHRRGYQTIQDRYALPADAFVYVADNPAKDFVAPRALGWRSVQIARPDRIHVGVPSAEPADAMITTLDELGDTIAALSG